MGGNRADAEDALGMAMEKAARAFARKAADIDNVEAWLRTLLRHACVDLHRARSHYAEAPEEGELLSDEAWPLGSEAVETPEDVLLHREGRHALRRHIAALPRDWRRPFLMRFKRGMHYDEIASRLALTNSNVRKRIQLSYKHLREALASEA
jgi:RNA polymerase sigma-70 factor (ECF subfamily)